MSFHNSVKKMNEGIFPKCFRCKFAHVTPEVVITTVFVFYGGDNALPSRNRRWPNAAGRSSRELKPKRKEPSLGVASKHVFDL